MTEKWKKHKAIAIEFAKWGLVLWLLLPIHRANQEPVDFARVVLGILLFILFIGKMLYDAILDNYKRKRDKGGIAELLSMVGVITVIAFVAGVAIFLIGFYAFTMIQNANVYE